MDFRKARTRTLIQVGGLVEKSGLLEALNLQVGDDLQRDPVCLESAAILMGALKDLLHHFYTDNSKAQKILWAEAGKKMLKKADKA